MTPPQPNAGDDDALEDGTGTALETASDAVGPYAGETLTEGQSRGTSGDASGGGTASGW